MLTSVLGGGGGETDRQSQLAFGDIAPWRVFGYQLYTQTMLSFNVL